MPRVNPPLPLADRNVYRFKVFGTHLGQQTINTFFYWQTLPGLPAPTLDSLHTAIRAAIMDQYRDSVSETWTQVKTTLENFSDPVIAPHEVNDPPTTIGTVLGPTLPTYACIRIYRNTLYAGQRGRGMIRLPAVSETGTDGNKVIVPYTIALPNFILGLNTPVSTADPAVGEFEGCIATRTVTLPPVVTAEVRAARIVSWAYNELMGTQNSRKQATPAA